MSEAEVEAVMKKCQRGFPRHMIDDSNDLHADCYGMIGALWAEVSKLRRWKAAALTITTEASVEKVME